MFRAMAAAALAAGALALAPGANGGSASRVVRSADGLLTLTIPAGALPAGTKVSIRAVSASTLPAPLRARAVNGPAYELEPAGLHFSKPITVTRRVHGVFHGGVPMLVPVSSEKAGHWERLAQPTILWDPTAPSLTVSATTTHFSEYALFDDAVRVSLSPDPVTQAVGTVFTATVHFAVPHADLLSVHGIQFSPSRQADVGDRVTVVPNVTYTAPYRCQRAGKGRYGVRLNVEDRSPEQEILNVLIGGKMNTIVDLQARAGCTGTKSATLPVLTTGCATVTHSKFGSFPSFLDFKLEFDPATLPPSPTVLIHARAINDEQPVSGPIDPTTGRAELKAGIRVFGTYGFDTVDVGGTIVDVSSFFSAFPVTGTPGLVAGTCP